MLYGFKLNVPFKTLLILILFCLIGLTSCKREVVLPPPPKSLMTNSLFNIFFVDMKRGWAVGKLGKIVYTDDGGEVWEAQESITDNSLEGIYFVNDQVGWVIGDMGTILHTTDGGQGWVSQESRTEQHLRDIFFLDLNLGWIVGEQGVVLTTTNGGKEWKERTDLSVLFTIEENPFPTSLFGIHFSDDQNGWIVGDYGLIIHTHDSGKSWNYQKSGTSDLLKDVTFNDSLNGWVVGESGTILHTTNGGKIWEIQNSGISYLLNGVTFEEEHGWIVGYGTILHTVDGGEHWSVQVKDKKMWLYGIDSVDKESIWVTCDFGEILHRNNRIKNWIIQLPWE